MIRVIVVDDELPIREALRSFDWSNMNAEYAGEAMNGQEGLQLCRSVSPDVVFLDIVMPVMDGLQMLTCLREEMPGVYVIILTCHQEYPYMRQAMQLGASDYILKGDIDDREISRVMNELSRHIDFAQKDRQKRELNGILERSMAFQQQWAKGTFDWKYWSKPCMVTMMVFSSKVFPFDVQYAMDAAKQRISVWYVLNNTHVIVLFDADVRSGDLRAFSSEINDALTESPSRLVVGGTAQDSESFSGAMRMVFEREQLIFYSQAGDVIDCSNAGFQAVNPKEVKQLQAKLMDYPERGDLAGFIRDEFRGWAIRNRADPQQLPGFLITLYTNWVGGPSDVANRQALAFAKKDFMTIDDLVEQAVHYLCTELQEENLLRWEVRHAIKIIHERCTGTLHLSDISREVGLSPNYLNSLFTKAVGMPYGDYVVQVRIDKARDMLNNSNAKVYEVAEMVGISDYRYFSVLFKQKIGCSPREYRLRSKREERERK